MLAAGLHLTTVDSRPRFRIIGIRLLESCLRPRPSLAAGIRIIAHVSLEKVDYAPASVFIPRNQSDRGVSRFR